MLFHASSQSLSASDHYRFTLCSCAALALCRGAAPAATSQDCTHSSLTGCAITCRIQVQTEPPLASPIELPPPWRRVPRPLRRPSAGINPRGCLCTWWWAPPSPVPPPTYTLTAATPRCASAEATSLADFPVRHHDPLRRQQGKSITSFAASPCRFECSQQFSCAWRPMCIKSCKAASKRGLEADARGDNLLCNVAPARFGTFTLCSHLQALDEDVTYLTLFQGGGAGTGQQGGAHERTA